MNYELWRNTEINRLYQECVNVRQNYNNLEWMRQDVLLAPNHELFPSVEIFIQAQREVYNNCIWNHIYIDMYQLDEVTRRFQEIMADEIIPRFNQP